MKHDPLTGTQSKPREQHEVHEHRRHPHGHQHHVQPHHEHGSHRHAEPLSHAPQTVESRRVPLQRGEAAGGCVLLDAFSGIAGDMTIAALVDLGVPFDVVQNEVAATGLSGYELQLSQGHAGAIATARFNVVLTEPHPERSYAEIDSMLERASARPEVVALARRIFERLARAEATIHGVPIEDVHFHEVGAVDAIVDVVGAAACFTYLGAPVISTPLPMGRGFVDCRHGRIPLPAPATLECLRGVPTTDAGMAAELVTPTGAAIVATVASSFSEWISGFSPQRIGWGGGSRTLGDRPNALRAVLGTRESAKLEQREDATHVVISANIDDMTGELAGYAIAQLLESGAADAWAAPITMKKGRPGWTLSALASKEVAEALASVMLRETTTVGVRKTPVSRTERPRRAIEVETAYGKVRVKISEGPYGPPQIKPEHDDCARLAREAQVPLRQVVAAVLHACASNATPRR